MNEIPVLQTKLKKYERKSKKKSADGKEHVTRRYMIPIKKDQIEGSKFENVEDIVILSNDDFNYEKEKSKNAASLIKELELSLKDRDKDIQRIHETKNKLKKIESEFAVIRENYANALKELELKNREIMKINNEYNDLLSENKGLKREVKRLRDLRTLEKESLRIKTNEIEITKEEYNKLKKSHELLWNVVREKDKTIKGLEEKGVMNSLLKKIIKKDKTK